MKKQKQDSPVKIKLPASNLKPVCKLRHVKKTTLSTNKPLNVYN